MSENRRLVVCAKVAINLLESSDQVITVSKSKMFIRSVNNILPNSVTYTVIARSTLNI